MRKYRNVFRFLLSFVLMFTLLFMQICFFINSSFLNADFYKEKLKDKEFFQELHEEINFGFKNLGMVTSIPEKVFSDSVDLNYIKELSYKNIDNTFRYMKYEISEVKDVSNTKAFEESLNKYIVQYAKENKLVIDESLMKQITAMSVEADKIVKNHSELFNIRAVTKYNEFQSFRKGIYLFYKNFYFPIIFVGLLISLLFLLNSKNLKRGFIWVGSSFVAGSLMTIIPSLLALGFKIPYRFSIGTSYLNEAVKEFTLGYIKYFLNFGVVLFIVGILNLVLYVILSNKARRERQGRSA